MELFIHPEEKNIVGLSNDNDGFFEAFRAHDSFEIEKFANVSHLSEMCTVISAEEAEEKRQDTERLLQIVHKRFKHFKKCLALAIKYLRKREMFQLYQYVYIRVDDKLECMRIFLISDSTSEDCIFDCSLSERELKNGRSILNPEDFLVHRPGYIELMAKELQSFGFTKLEERTYQANINIQL